MHRYTAKVRWSELDPYAHLNHAVYLTMCETARIDLLDQIGWGVEDVDLWEVNEAFAVVPMAFMQEMSVPHEKLNVNGGACALGHPIGASGTRIIVTLLNALGEQGKTHGMASLCHGTGGGTALAVERL